MRWLWKLTGRLIKPADRKRRIRCFRLLNCALAALLGLAVWLIVRLFALNSLDWLICFIGYPVMFHGILGSSLYLMHRINDSEE